MRDARAGGRFAGLLRPDVGVAAPGPARDVAAAGAPGRAVAGAPGDETTAGAARR